MPRKNLRIDLVSDVVCPWCIIGYKRLEKAMADWTEKVGFELYWHPFELNPDMPDGGQNLRAHLARKYGTSLEQSIAARKRLTQMGESLGFAFNYYDEMRMYNTFKAHQLLHWAKQYGKQTDLKLRLFAAYFGEQKAIDEPEVLLAEAGKVGLDVQAASAVLKDDLYADAVKQIESQWLSRGIHAVPVFIFNERYLISGAQSPEVFAAQIADSVAEAA